MNIIPQYISTDGQRGCMLEGDTECYTLFELKDGVWVQLLDGISAETTQEFMDAEDETIDFLHSLSHIRKRVEDTPADVMGVDSSDYEPEQQKAGYLGTYRVVANADGTWTLLEWSAEDGDYITIRANAPYEAANSWLKHAEWPRENIMGKRTPFPSTHKPVLNFAHILNAILTGEQQ